ncbi:class I SAM-dependent methyltransferase [Xanthocytophaga flava]|uniref:class I SAM-dependent methyltransferase n=1 Tax=Xanthocytophaga flava TaxID=3048013 RepID=UPI0028D03F82|nr:class I SAM-dependent methyltransferase [Xanthocytophaga flavus]MDJ1473114.1 class I SAM-dependent methyltransferase [Xanthocytophaga flavus]
MPENLKSCPVCNTLVFKHFLVCKDYTVSKQEFQIVRCESCGFKFTNPRPAAHEIGAFYQSEDYISHSNTNKGLINKAYQIVRNYTLKNKLKLINSLHTKGTLLDIGCGTGAFLQTCSSAGWQVKGTEPDSNARAFAGSNNQLTIEPDFLTAYPDEQFDIITMWHVLEHVHLLSETLDKLRRNLSSDGKLVIAVPNSESYDAKYYNQYWAAYDVPRHLYHFAPKTLTQLIEKFGFKIAEVKPMYFDAFYISMLSTKYRDGKINYAEAVSRGLKSNSWAKKNNDNYSSLIYIFKIV